MSLKDYLCGFKNWMLKRKLFLFFVVAGFLIAVYFADKARQTGLLMGLFLLPIIAIFLFLIFFHKIFYRKNIGE